MAAPKCFGCARWSVKTGCALESESYWDFRDCTLDERDFMIPRIVREEEAEHGRAKDVCKDDY